jgi:hypothetical protein
MGHMSDTKVGDRVEIIRCYDAAGETPTTRESAGGATLPWRRRIRLAVLSRMRRLALLRR